MAKARITYRFEPEQRKQTRMPSSGEQQIDKETEPGKVIRLYQDEYRVQDEIPSYPPQGAKGTKEIHDMHALNPYTTDYGAWSSPFEAETERVERLIRESGVHSQENAGTQGRHNRPLQSKENPDKTAFHPDTGYFRYRDQEGYDSESEEPIPGHYRYVPRSDTPWLKIFASAVGAIATGAIFGFLVLSMFNGDSGKSVAGDWFKRSNAPTGPSAAAQSAGTVTGTTGGNAAGSSAVGGGAALPVNGSAPDAVTRVSLPATTYTFLQGGVFSNQQGAETAMSALRKNGLAAASENADKVYVYTGFAMNRNDALLLSSALQQKKVDVYIKSYTLPSATAVKWSGMAGESPETYLTQGGKLVQIISGLTVLHLQEKSPAAPEDTSMQAIKTAHQAWNQTAVKVGEGLQKEAKPIAERMNSAMNAAVIALDEYKKNPSETLLWQAQGALLNYIVAEKELLSAIAVQ